jgi:hypothetical protein
MKFLHGKYIDLINGFLKKNKSVGPGWTPKKSSPL